MVKSKNSLSITGTIATDVPESVVHPTTRFWLVHNFGGGKSPIFLACVAYSKPGRPILVPRKGTNVSVEAYLRSNRGEIEAVVKKITINQ